MDKTTADEIAELEDRLDHLEHIHPDRTWTMTGFATSVYIGLPTLIIAITLAIITTVIISTWLKRKTT